MIIKHADDHSADLETLQTLLDHPGADAITRTRITAEVRRIKAGARGEAAAAYEIDRLFGSSDKHAVIHDLRIEVDGQVAQIDHLVINRFLSAFLCETKNFAEGLSCNTHGEWVGFRNNRPFGIASPLHQGARHCDILRILLQQGHPWHPRRLGGPIGVRMEHFVLVSNTARITRPKAGTVPDIDRVVKIEGFGDRREAYADRIGTMEALAKIVSSDTLSLFAEGLAGCHVPAAPDWHTKFGLSRSDPTLTTIRRSSAPGAPIELPTQDATDDPAAKKKLICMTCGSTIAFVVARFCWRNAKRFGGHMYCRDCQAQI